jgi:hypothetical protein
MIHILAVKPFYIQNDKSYEKNKLRVFKRVLNALVKGFEIDFRI